MSHSNVSMQAGVFKAKCLQLMDEVRDHHINIIITKHGKPVAKLVPIDDAQRDYFGCLKNTIVIKEDIMSPIAEHWESNE